MAARASALRLVVAVVAAARLGTPFAEAAAPNPRERIDFWRENYTSVTAQADARVARAEEIFERLVRAAGRRAGVEPRLHVIAEDPANVTLPIAIPDGWVVLSRRVLELCYRVPARGDDRLAFVLAHEIAHQLEDDFWHMKFFQAIESLHLQAGDKRVLAELRDIAAQTDKAAAKELRADEQGIAIAAMAGFDPAVVVGDSDADNFFSEWEAALDLARLRPASHSHPRAPQRAAAVRARLGQIVAHAELFQLGVLYYQAGDFGRAIRAFDEFQRYFPAREVNHNLGTAHHQLALAAAPPPNDVPFKLSISIDPLTRAVRGSHRSAGADAQAFRRHLTQAIRYYEQALAQDPEYLPAYRNLAGAYLHHGAAYKAVAILQDALALAPKDASVLNNLGVALYHTRNVADARAMLERARAADRSYDAPLFNLALVARQTGDAAAAQRHWRDYLQLDASSDWARLARRHASLPDEAKPPPLPSVQPESLASVEVGTYRHEIPSAWGAPVSVRTFRLESDLESRVTRYPNGVLTVALGQEIRQLAALPGYAGQTARGIRGGSRRAEVEARYGPPAQVLTLTAGESLRYPAHGITFNMHEGRVVSWLLYWE